MIKLGSKVRDVISGYEGTATARSEYLNGCVSVCIEGPLAKNEKGVVQRDELWVDEQRIQVVAGSLFSPQGDYAGSHDAGATDRRLATAGGPDVPVPPRDGR